MTVQSVLKVLRVPDVITAIFFTLEDIYEIDHDFIKKSRSWSGTLYSGGSDGDRTRNLPELHSGRSNQLLNVF